MNTKLTLAAAMLLAVPCAMAQGPADPAKTPAPAARPAYPMPQHGDRGGHDDRGGDRMHFGGPEGHGGGDARLLPPGTWWRNQEVVTRIGLAADQQKHIDQIFLDSRVQLIHMHASLEEGQLRLDAALSSSPFNQTQALAEIDKIADTRAGLEKANAKMLLSIRGVLTADQWTKLQTRPAGREGWRPGGNRPGGPGGNDWRGGQGGQSRQGGGPRGGGGAHPSTPPAAE